MRIHKEESLLETQRISKWKSQENLVRIHKKESSLENSS